MNKSRKTQSIVRFVIVVAMILIAAVPVFPASAGSAEKLEITGINFIQSDQEGVQLFAIEDINLGDYRMIVDGAEYVFPDVEVKGATHFYLFTQAVPAGFEWPAVALGESAPIFYPGQEVLFVDEEDEIFWRYEIVEAVVHVTAVDTQNSTVMLNVRHGYYWTESHIIRTTAGDIVLPSVLLASASSPYEIYFGRTALPLGVDVESALLVADPLITEPEETIQLRDERGLVVDDYVLPEAEPVESFTYRWRLTDVEIHIGDKHPGLDMWWDGYGWTTTNPNPAPSGPVAGTAMTRDEVIAIVETMDLGVPDQAELIEAVFADPRAVTTVNLNGLIVQYLVANDYMTQTEAEALFAPVGSPPAATIVPVSSPPVVVRTEVCYATPKSNFATRREEPSTLSDMIDQPGTTNTFEVTGHYNGSDGVWYQLTRGWMRNDVVELSGECGAIPEVDYNGVVVMSAHEQRLMDLDAVYRASGPEAWLSAAGYTWTSLTLSARQPEEEIIGGSITVIGYQIEATNLSLSWPAGITTDQPVSGRCYQPDPRNVSQVCTDVTGFTGTATVMASVLDWGQFNIPQNLAELTKVVFLWQKLEFPVGTLAGLQGEFLTDWIVPDGWIVQIGGVDHVFGDLVEAGEVGSVWVPEAQRPFPHS